MNCVCNFSEQPQVKPDFVQVSSVTTEVVACDEIATLLKCIIEDEELLVWHLQVTVWFDVCPQEDSPCMYITLKWKMNLGNKIELF